jgi:hypothetical protein
MANLNIQIWQAAWEAKVAERLDKSQNWKEVCDVRYTDTQATNFPLISTANEPAVTTAQFASAAGRSDLTKVIPFIGVTYTNETLSVTNTDIDSVYMDYADQAQSRYADWADLGDLLGKKINERVESLVLGNSAGWTNFGDTGGGVLGLSATKITVSSTNVASIIRGIIEQIITANGYAKYKADGGFIIWRPADWTLLTQYMQANGFYQADLALKNGGGDVGGVELVGIPYMGLFHYVSTLGTAGSLMAGVRRVQILGLLKSTYGQTYRDEMPPSSTAGALSGTQIHARLDWGLLVQTNMKPIIFNVEVN